MQIIQQVSHPGNKDLFHNTAWGLSSNFPLRPVTLFPMLTSVTRLHSEAQSVRGPTKAVSTATPSPEMKTRRKKEQCKRAQEFRSQMSDLQMFGPFQLKWLKRVLISCRCGHQVESLPVSERGLTHVYTHAHTHKAS